mgnify:CR=1 FL=1
MIQGGFMRRYLPTERSKTSCLLLTVLVIGYYLCDNLSLFSFMGRSPYGEICRLFFWSMMIVIVRRLPKIRPEAKIRHRSDICFRAFLFAFIHIALWFCLGLFEGFGKNPFNTALSGILRNVLAFGPVLIGREWVRNHIARHGARKENYFVLIITALFFTLTNFNITRYSGLTDLQKLVQFMARFFLPEFSRNLMATYLSQIGGTSASLLYLGVFEAVNYVSPVLPDLKWITAALVGIMCPVFSFIWMQDIYLREAGLVRKSKQDNESIIGWAVTCILSIGIVWFASGVFPIYPSVIATGSMEPFIKPGDMILVKKVQNMSDIEDIKVGDIIQFRKDNILICHRVVEILSKEDGLYYRTKGDNNSEPDPELVRTEQIRGKITQVIPKIGWPTLLLKSKDNIPPDELEF